MWITSAFSVDNFRCGLWITSAGCFPGSVRPSGCGLVPTVAEGCGQSGPGPDFSLGAWRPVAADPGGDSPPWSGGLVAGASGSVRPCRSVRGWRPWVRVSGRPAVSDPVRAAAGPGRAWLSLGERRAGGLIMGRRSGLVRSGRVLCGPGPWRGRMDLIKYIFPAKGTHCVPADCVCNPSRYG